jgi:PST family polysaccharide transporter
MLNLLYRSPALRTAAAFAIGGVAFSVGNLILARFLSAEAYGLVSLVVGLISLAVLIAPLGIDTVVTRRGWPLGTALRRRALAASVLTGLVMTILGYVLYDLSAPLLVCLFVATTSGGVTQATGAHFQSQRQFSISVLILQASNWAIVVAGLVAAVSGSKTAVPASATLAAIALVTAVISWVLVARETVDVKSSTALKGLWADSIPLLATTGASAIFMQLERLVIPKTIGISELALFGVLAALVGSPFRMIQSAVVFTLVPRLRDAGTVRARRQLLRREGVLILSVVLLGSVVICVLAAPITHLLFADRYVLTNSLLLATIVSGVLKIISAFAMTAASTLAPAARLRLLGVGSWACVALTIAASYAAAPWGLVGIIYAVAFGWVVRCLMATWMSLPYLTHQKSAP